MGPVSLGSQRSRALKPPFLSGSISLPAATSRSGATCRRHLALACQIRERHRRRTPPTALGLDEYDGEGTFAWLLLDEAAAADERTRRRGVGSRSSLPFIGERNGSARISWLRETSLREMDLKGGPRFSPRRPPKAGRISLGDGFSRPVTDCISYFVHHRGPPLTAARHTPHRSAKPRAAREQAASNPLLASSLRVRCEFAARWARAPLGRLI